MKSNEASDGDWKSLLHGEDLEGWDLMTPEPGVEMGTSWSSMRPASTNRTR